MFIYQKTVDRSTLRQGFQIPVEFHPLLATMPGGMPVHGETRDYSARIVEKERIQKVRHLDRSIGESLKRIYDFHCQMTGERIIHAAKPEWDPYGKAFIYAKDELTNYY